MSAVDRDSRPGGAELERPLDLVGSIKVKIGLLVAVSILAAVVIFEVGDRSSVSAWLTIPVSLAAALGVTAWLARGMTAPLRQMTVAAGQMAGGDYTARVTTASRDEVGQLGVAFNTMSAELADADRQRRELLATVSHELRTPLAAQRALLENLVDGVVTPDDRALQTALDQSERLSTLVQDLLDLSRIEAGVAALSLEPVAVGALLARCVEEARASVGATGRGVAVDLDVTPPDLHVEADPARLAQVVTNLLDNAVRHSPEGGTVRVGAVGAGPTWTLEVADEGPGFPAGRSEEMFARFGVGDDSSGGTGLGLAIVRWVCELHGGRVEAVETAADRTGALVRVELPVATAADGSGPREARPLPLTAPPGRAAKAGRAPGARPGPSTSLSAGLPPSPPAVARASPGPSPCRRRRSSTPSSAGSGPSRPHDCGRRRSRCGPRSAWARSPRSCCPTAGSAWRMPSSCSSPVRWCSPSPPVGASRGRSRPPCSASGWPASWSCGPPSGSPSSPCSPLPSW
ncbi:HAMP domain-containing sensor histidine kinase [Serinicoccus profundi]|uniref:HAMP domain-containing sensor histidine kinase n=1 Tax=Serinicoccus profundi TaxID=1078471 RepID=UPI001EE85EE2|nr:HAMP domain-containing sensor histidine kinase [Serinicoccus profundi]